MKSTDAIAATTLAMVDAMIADAGKRWNTGSIGEGLVRWSAVITAAGVTGKDEDGVLTMAFKSFIANNANY